MGWNGDDHGKEREESLNGMKNWNDYGLSYRYVIDEACLRYARWKSTRARLEKQVQKAQSAKVATPCGALLLEKFERERAKPGNGNIPR
jgi:hypothetical protein